MVKNVLKNKYLLDTFDDESIDLDIEETDETDENIVSEIEDDNLNLDNDIPKIEFIIEKNEENEKQIRLNFEFKMEESDEIIKLDIEISRNTYLELADELLN